MEYNDIRLNRPKGLRRLPGLGQGQGQEQEYLEIIDANDRPSIIECWTEECLIDALFLELATTKSLVSHNGKCGITVHKYYSRAMALLKWIPIARPAPEFIVNLSDLSTRVIAELKVLNDPQVVLKRAVGRIFENIDPVQYHLSIASQLKVELVR